MHHARRASAAIAKRGWRDEATSIRLRGGPRQASLQGTTASNRFDAAVPPAHAQREQADSQNVDKHSTIYENSLKKCVDSKQVFVLVESSKIPWRFQDADAFLDCLEKTKDFSRSCAEFRHVLSKVEDVFERGASVGQVYTILKRCGRLNTQEGVALAWRYLEPRVGELNEKSRINVLWSLATSRKPPSNVPAALAEVKDYTELDPLHLYRLLLSCAKMGVVIPWKRLGPALIAMLRDPECKTFYLPRILTAMVESAPHELSDQVIRVIRRRIDDLEYRDLDEIYQALAHHYQEPEMLLVVERQMKVFHELGAVPQQK